MTLTRRDLLHRTGWLCTVAIAPNLVACDDDSGADGITDGSGGGSGDGSGTPDWQDDLPVYEYGGEPGPDTLFEHGVASGDPLADAVILWTRVSPSDAPDSLQVWFEISENSAFTQRVSVGEIFTDASQDWTVKLDAVELEPGRTYYYRFFCLGQMSPIGRTRTAAAGSVDRLRFAVVSCQSYQHGYFHTHRQLAQMPDLDAVLHLGDYIYEYAPGEYGRVREHEPAREIVTLEDYRERYSQYRRDADLANAHRQHPFIVVWDDHEFTNNAWTGGAANHQPDREGDWADRSSAARQAYREWMPIREFEGGRIYRGFAFGDLVDLLMLDTRAEGRDEQTDTSDRESHADPNRSLLGDAQHEWVAEQLRSSTAAWRIIGQQVMFAQWKLVGVPLEVGPGQVLNADGWDGYEAARNRILDQLESEGIEDVVILTGDVHSTWVFDVTRDPANDETYDPETGAGSVATEYVCTAVTSPALDLAGASEAIVGVLQEQNPHLKYGNFEKRGYLVLDITPEQAHCGVWLFEDIEDPEDIEPFNESNWTTLRGTATAVEADPVEAPRAADLAP